MFRYRKILVPLDGSELGERALSPAVRLAEAMSASLVLLRVVPALPMKTDLNLDEKLVHSRRVEAQTYLASVCSDLESIGVDVKGEVVLGAAAKSIVRYAARNEVDLIMICSHGRSGLGRWVLGSVTSRVLRKAPCSTLVVRAKKIVPLFSQNQVLVPLDGSPLAEEALAPALAIAQAVSAQVTLLSVVFSLGELAPALYQHHLDRITGEAQIDKAEYLGQVRAAWQERGVPMETAVETGAAGESIVAYAQRHAVDLIVMCSHGRAGVEHWAYGSVTEKVLQGAPCATLVVRGENVG